MNRKHAKNNTKFLIHQNCHPFQLIYDCVQCSINLIHSNGANKSTIVKMIRKLLDFALT